MGVSGLTAIIIATRDDLIITHGGPSKDNGKYVGWLTMPESEYCRPLLNTEAVFDTAEEAQKCMEELVVKIRVHMKKEMDGRDAYGHIMHQVEEKE